ncbi:glycosyltransferase [Paenibacillus rigui]|uniref:Glycosyl transferase n=1 Tax=Paenibacillus rigui TaxID=554312 RepID=A0A229UPD4_9BACL|nr:glycosyltransferase [Paenibacillus rigui]OXM85220.1 glycosyl transferase [Paenibacillus rigui]
MKIKLLFVMNKLTCGGAEKALISMLETIDYSRYDVDLFLFKHEGVFLGKLPKPVRLLPEPDQYKYFDMPVKRALTELLGKGKLQIALYRLILGWMAKTEKNGAVIEQKLWKYMSKAIAKLPQEYDAAIGYQEKNPIYFCVDHVRAKTKIGWIHTDYSKLGIDPSRESPYFGELDYIVTVSDPLVDILRTMFPQYSGKLKCVHNIISSNVVRELSLEPVDFQPGNASSVSVISVGRLAKEKGLEISLDAIDILVKKGYDIRWYVIGEGNLRTELETGIKNKKLEDRVTLLGLKENPYPYIRQSDIYIQTSRYEGRSISIEEAKILGKPIVITNFDTASNHIRHESNGLIARMDAESVASQLERMIQEEALQRQFTANLKKEDFGTEDEIDKFYQLVQVV